MSRAGTLSRAIGSDGVLNVGDIAGLAAVASSGSASDLGSGTLPIARIADGDITNAKINSVAATKVSYNNAVSGISGNTVQEAIDYLKSISGGASAGQQASYTRQKFTATAGQTTFTTSGYTVGYLEVYLNGVLLDISDYAATNGTTVVLTSGAAAGDELVTIALDSFAIAELLRVTLVSASAPTDSFVIDANGNLTGYVKNTASQGLTSTEKTNARTNIGAQADLGYTPVNKAGDTITGDLQLSGASLKRTMTADGVVFEVKGSYAGNPVLISFGQQSSDGFISIKDASGNETFLSGWTSGTSKFASKLRANNVIEKQISFTTGAETNILKLDDGAGNYGGRIASYNNGGYYQDLRIYTTDAAGNNEKLAVVLDGRTRSLQTFGQQYATWTETVQTINGGLQTVRILEDCYGRWVLAGRFAADAALSIRGVWSSVRGLSTALDQNTTAFSADFGDTYPSEVRVLGATDFSRWKDTRTIDFVYKVPNGRPWKNFFNNNSTTGNTNISQITRRGFSVAGSYDGFGRWNNPLLTEIGLSDVDYACPTSAFTTPTANAFDWNSVTGGDDAKLLTIHSGSLASQDSNVTTGFGSDDGGIGFFDSYPNISSNMNGGRTFSSAVWILLKLN